MSVSIRAAALNDVQKFFDAVPDVAEQAAVLSINRVAGVEGMTMIREEMRKEVEFPSGYLEQSDRLAVTRKASRGVLEAVISGRDRPTSLARFAAGQTRENTKGRGVRVMIKGEGGNSVLMRKAFLITLRNGNVGVAVRLKPGDSLRHSAKAVQLENNLFLLYGPSVDQVFKGVAQDVSPAIAETLSNEFFRQFARLSANG